MGLSRLQPWPSGRRHPLCPGTPGENETSPHSKSGACRAPFWGQASAGQAAPDGGGRMGTARRQERPQNAPMGRSSLAIPGIRVIAAIYYLGPRSPKYLLVTPRWRDVNACMVFKSPTLLPLQGQEMSRDGGWPEPMLRWRHLPALPEPGRTSPDPARP